LPALHDGMHAHGSEQAARLGRLRGQQRDLPPRHAGRAQRRHRRAQARARPAARAGAAAAVKAGWRPLPHHRRAAHLYNRTPWAHQRPITITTCPCARPIPAAGMDARSVTISVGRPPSHAPPATAVCRRAPRRSRGSPLASESR